MPLFSERDAGGFSVAAAIVRNQIFGGGAFEVGPNPTRTLLANPYSNPTKRIPVFRPWRYIQREEV
jgi:hypothetical protein